MRKKAKHGRQRSSSSSKVTQRRRGKVWSSSRSTRSACWVKSRPSKNSIGRRWASSAAKLKSWRVGLTNACKSTKSNLQSSRPTTKQSKPWRRPMRRRLLPTSKSTTRSTMNSLLINLTVKKLFKNKPRQIRKHWSKNGRKSWIRRSNKRANRSKRKLEMTLKDSG